MNKERVVIAVLLLFISIQFAVTYRSIQSFKAAEKLFREDCGAKQTLFVKANPNLGTIPSPPPMIASVCCGAIPPAEYFGMLRNIPRSLFQFYSGLIVGIAAAGTVIRIRRGRGKQVTGATGAEGRDS